MVSRVVSAITAAAVLATVGCGRSWPTTTPAKADPTFLARGRSITTVDILPVDVEAWTHKKWRGTADELRFKAEAGLVGAASRELLQRGYLVGNTIGWDGQFVADDGSNATAMPPDAILATVDALSSYGIAVEQSPGLPVPYLPSRLGEVTGADATLYIGGWTYGGDDHSTANKVAKGVLIGVAIIGVVIVVAAIAKGGGGDGLGKVAGGAARGAGKLAASVGRTAARAALRAGNVTFEVLKHTARTLDAIDPEIPVRIVEASLDAWGRSSTHIHLVPGGNRPEWSQRPGVPHSGKSQTYVEMTLVDNKSGTVLWHARQQFPAHGASDGATDRMVRMLMGSLPAAGPDPLLEYR
jgi:hypothetical protein